MTEDIKDREDIKEESEEEKEDISKTEENEAVQEDKAEQNSSSEEPTEKAEEKKEDEDLQTRFLRLSADFQNFRRRSEAEKADIYAYANEKIILQLLDVMDNFDRAMSAAAEGDKFAEGMQLILKQLEEVLTKNNVAEIEALGSEFDPNLHHAVMTEAGEESNKVTQVLQKGYTLNGKVIRPSMVAVSQ